MPIELTFSQWQSLAEWGQQGCPCNGLTFDRVVTADQSGRELTRDLGSRPILTVDDISFMRGRDGLTGLVSTFPPGYQVTIYTHRSSVHEQPDPSLDAKEARWLLRFSDDVIRALAEFRPLWGYACSWAETCDRHVCKVPVSWSSRPCTVPVGQDLTRYVPGLYWKNYFSREYLEQRGLAIEGIAEALDGRLQACGDGVVLTLYNSPADWKESSDRIDEFLLANPAFFSIRRICTRRVENTLEIHDYMKSITDRWP